MIKDLIVEELHLRREEHARIFNNDLNKIFEELRKQEMQYKIVNLAERRILQHPNS